MELVVRGGVIVDRRLAELEDDRVATIYAAQLDRLVALGCLLTGNPADAEDLAQEVFTDLIRRSRVEPGFLREPSWPWLRLAMVRLAMRRRHQVAAELRRMMRAYQPPVEAQWSEESLGYLAAISRLPARMRACVVLFYQEDLSTAQVAETLHCSTKTVENQLREGRRRLAAELRLADAAPVAGRRENHAQRS